ncbi:MAG: hypothetical protein JSW61_02850 [Candidatus Thorarchaeota archaeon]|nr:MAG: hypothetical protein JSW61_02850 [Candidatus Thorarchaeota archaeon]
MNGITIRVYVESSSKTIHAADMDTIGHPMCTQTRSPVDKLGVGRDYFPQDQIVLLDAVTRAAQKMEFTVEVVDVSKYSFFRRYRSKGNVPRIEIAFETGQSDIVLDSIPTSDELVKLIQDSQFLFH